ncbi:unnamed protein product [Gadus morhua 'NCC']
MVAGITMHVSVAPPCGLMRAHAYYQPGIGGFLECGIQICCTGEELLKKAKPYSQTGRGDSAGAGRGRNDDDVRGVGGGWEWRLCLMEASQFSGDTPD